MSYISIKVRDENNINKVKIMVKENCTRRIGCYGCFIRGPKLNGNDSMHISKQMTGMSHMINGYSVQSLVSILIVFKIRERKITTWCHVMVL